MAHLDRDDVIEQQYKQEINKALSRGDVDKANEMTIALAEYRRSFKVKQNDRFEK